MSAVQQVANLVVRQAFGTESAQASTTGTAATPAATTNFVQVACDSENGYDGRIGVRISAIFVILLGSAIGATFPTYAARHRGLGVPDWAFFIAKYFGSGVIIATAFIHLLAPANAALTSPCLSGPITDYDWVEGIALMTIFSLFFVELMAMRFAIFATPANLTLPNPENGHSHGHDLALQSVQRRASQHQPGEDHLSHTKDHIDNEDAVLGTENNSSLEKNNIDRVDSIAAMPTGNLQDIEDYRAQLTAILILEFGVIFHSIFIGLTLAVAGDEFNTLYIVLVFHQTFEGLGLGSRLAVTPWPKNHLYTPYLFGVAYAFSTPIAIAIGLGVRTTYAPGSNTALIVNGVFDSISAGILIYTGLVELMAHEFMFSSSMRRASIKVVLFAVLVMCLGAGLMALLGKWA